MMTFDADVARSYRRSAARRRLMRAMRRLRVAYPSDLARTARVRLHRVDEIMHGRPPAYRRELSPIRLGLVRKQRGSDGVQYTITPRGARVVSRL